MGRPSKFTPKLVAIICERLADGESLRTICADEVMPSRQTVRCWLRDDPVFASQYARAREEQADVLLEEILDIADDGSRDYKQDGDGRLVPDQDHIQRSRLRVDARKWAASKMAPKKYGDRIAHEHGGKDGATAIVQELRWLDPVDPPGEGEG